MPKVTVLYFAVLRERRGCESEVVDFTPGETAADLYERLFPSGPDGSLPVGFARNQALAAGGDALEDGDELALLPPLGGG